ncbi:zinc finger protein 184-like isoform X2 [Periplaneta americana]|uniref:zinc finger protein 184-like isoform X2 n=1 Tax=Periplaneta americana TaxID=6978 RepID=UPI0037E8EE4B
MALKDELHDNIYLIGNYCNQIIGSNLPSNKQVLNVLFCNIRKVKLDLRVSAGKTVDEVIIFWQKAHIPTRKRRHCISKLESLYSEWRNLQKSANKKSEQQRQKEKSFTSKLNDLFDIAHANALEVTGIEDRQFLIAQRQKGRIDFIQEKIEMRMEKDLIRKKQSYEEIENILWTSGNEVMSNNLIDEDMVQTSASPSLQDFISPKLAAAMDKSAMEMSAIKVEDVNGDEVVLKSELEYHDEALSLTMKNENMSDANITEEKNEFKWSEGDVLKTNSEEEMFCELETEETYGENIKLKEELTEEVAIEDHGLILPDRSDDVQDDNSKSCFVLQNNVINFLHDGMRKETEEERKRENQNTKAIIDRKKIIKCDVCGKVFSKKQLLVIHYRSHTGEKPYKCDICEKSFGLRGNLVIHQTIHTAGKPFVCDICGKAFRLRNNLARHITTHTGEKPFKCSICENSFSQRGHLLSHMRTHTKEKPYKCDVCGKEFSQRGILVIHARIHTGEKPHKCDVCGHTFAKKWALERHTRTHTGEKPYRCNVCGKTFGQRGILVGHSLIHTGEKPFKCDICGRGFNQRTSRNYHLKTHTKKK